MEIEELWSVRWRIYYDDWTTWESGCGLPPEPKRLGVLVIAQSSPDKRFRLLSAGDFYWFDGDGWLAVDSYGMLDAVIYNLKGIKCVVSGRTVPDKRFADVYAQAKRDADNDC